MAEADAAIVDSDWSAQMRASVNALDPVVALLALVHLTGDRTLLATHGPAFDGVPRSGGSSFSAKAAQAPKEPDAAIVADIRARLIAVMESEPTAVITTPDRALFKQMANFFFKARAF